MDVKSFDRFTKTLGIGASRRRLLAGLGGGVLTGLLSLQGTPAASCAKEGQKPKDHKPCCGDLERNQHGRCAPVECLPEGFFVTCDGKCGIVSDNCGEEIDCGIFCGECGECPNETHICRPKQRGTPCGEPGSGRCCIDGSCSPNASYCGV